MPFQKQRILTLLDPSADPYGSGWNIIQSKIDTYVRTTDDEISSKFVEAAAFAYLAYKNQGIIFKPKL